LYCSNFLFFRSHAPLGDLLTLSKLFWKALLVKKKLRTPASTGCNPVQEKSGMREVTFSYRVDVFFRLLVPAALFVTVFKSYRSVFLNTYTYLIISPPPPLPPLDYYKIQSVEKLQFFAVMATLIILYITGCSIYGTPFLLKLSSQALTFFILVTYFALAVAPLFIYASTAC
jgi:hypothetical protein